MGGQFTDGETACWRCGHVFKGREKLIIVNFAEYNAGTETMEDTDEVVELYCVPCWGKVRIPKLTVTEKTTQKLAGEEVLEVP